ncbi:uncharacterized protein LOC130899876 [Diorhabda carinulata]|uniref:uncharacterized protein LOC130899876 n=1 Tax=Diorhabda carinulata TaxID=1163345 RepID=UPI0025A250FE|nr:uncharacterized protein LOC130899876 [Diorhabda carinulata]
MLMYTNGTFFFNGKGSLMEFLEQIEMLRASRGLSEEELFIKSCELFKDAALTWFLTNKSKITSWASLVAKLKKDFLPSNYQFDLEIQIANRTQGPQESATLYIAEMESLFKRLEIIPEETTRVLKIRRNLLPLFVSQLALHDTNTIDELSNLCKQIEDSQTWSERYRMLQSDNPRGSCSQSFREHNAKTSNKVQFKENKISQNVSTLAQVVCYNCDRNGHKYSQCRDIKRIFCYGCGMKNVVKTKCNFCAQKNAYSTAYQSKPLYRQRQVQNMRIQSKT